MRERQRWRVSRFFFPGCGRTRMRGSVYLVTRCDTFNWDPAVSKNNFKEHSFIYLFSLIFALYFLIIKIMPTFPPMFY